ncbi:MAG TPA: type II and III secretion system protein, partial [Nitrospinaceae bacterium]|nr:type II and III secretion system protein [Nitrospinaceae bacterium]
MRVRLKNIRLLNSKIVFLVALTVIGGCSTFQNTPSSRTEPQEPEKTMQQLAFQEPKETMQQLAPLLLEGTKPLLIDEQEDFLPSTKSTVLPCVDARTRKERRFLLADLKSELIPLAYSNMERVITALEVMGVKTIVATGPIAKPYTVSRKGKATMLPVPKLTHDKIGYTCSDLPIFYQPKTTPVQSLTEVLKGPHPSTTGSRFSMVNMAPTDYGLNDSLIAFYHPASKRRFENIKKTIDQTLDAAPIQIYIESMVLEVNESGLDELGALYKNNSPGLVNQTFQAGILSPLSPSSMTSANPIFTTTFAKGAGATAVAELLSIQIQALISKGSAEVLSRPSVITLNNRPAVIEVTEQSQFPIRTASTGYSGVVTLSYSFEEVTPGIILQLRPRVSEKRNEVALEIDVQVKALVTANDGVAVNDSGTTVATKPGSSTRRVHTFALVPNKTPIIIGGLVTRDNEETTNKLPFLGDLPFIGPFFGARSSTKERKEVIIVITPHIIRDNNTIGIQTPKDTAMFDDSDMELFRDSYRVRSEDFFDLGFVYRSQQFQKYRNYVVSRSESDKEFAKTPLAQSFSGAHFPGGEGLVARMIYDIVGKRDLAKPVSRDKIIITEHDGDGKFKDVTFLEKVWQKAQSKSVPANEDGRGGKDYGLELTFSGKETDASVQPHVALRILPLLEIALLQETDKTHKNSSRIFIASEKDLKKIRKAIVVREIQKLNRSKHISGPLNEFRKGTKLILPVIHTTRYFLLDSEVATVYNQIKFYYQILEQSLRESFRLIEEEIKKENEVHKRKAEELRRTQQLKRQTQQRQTQPRTKATSPTKPSKPPTTGTKATSPTKP